ncbi:MAG: acylphosphatase [Myxococcota bacterium]
MRRRVVVRGRVQGVFFRGSTEAEARRCGVSGWVRNRPDGSVEAAFEGEEAAVECLVAFCRRGPQWARVSHVEVTPEEPVGDVGFRIRS